MKKSIITSKYLKSIKKNCLVCKSNLGEKRIFPGPSVYEGKYWLIEHAYPSKLLGWLVLVLKRHAEGMHELSSEEFKELSILSEKIIKVFHTELKTKKEYLACFAEAEGFSHIHFHVIPKTEKITNKYKGVKVFEFIKIKKENGLSVELISRFINQIQPHFK